MPKKTNPGTITTGAGSAPEEESNYTLNSGQVVADPDAKHDHGKPGLNVHTESVIDAHPASAITIDGQPASFFAHSVEGALDELAGALPPRPPSLGNWRPFMGFSGIPDWGKLKLRDASLQFNDASVFASTSAFPSETYPYYWYPVIPAHLTRSFDAGANGATSDLGPFVPGGLTDPAMQNLLEYKNSVLLNPSLADTFRYQEYNTLDLSLDPNGDVILTKASEKWAFPFLQSVKRWSAGGNDPNTDPMYNVWSVQYTPGAGLGNTYEGAYTQPLASPMWGNADNVALTMRVVKTDPNDSEIDVTVSGTLFPSDRGILALVYWPENGKMAEFVAQPLGTKVPAAILLGQGLSNQANSCECDGEPGGIFLPGADNAGNHDPYVWPGQATGQASLYEIYSGLAFAKSLPTTQGEWAAGATMWPFTPLSPYYNFDGKVSGTTLIAGTAPNGGTPTYTDLNVVGHDYLENDVVTVADAAQVPDGNYFISAILGADFFTIEYASAGLGGPVGTVQRIVGCSKQEYPSQGADAFPGQVRLGTREEAITGVTPIADGVPIFGAYDKARGGGNLTNFLSFRLPYLSNYSQTPEGLKWTPVSEKVRYKRHPWGPWNGIGLFIPESINYGNYGNFEEDYYPYQVARYRHSFQIPRRGQGTQLGSYMLVHFKTEQSFEELVRDGVWPTDDKIYSANISNVADVNAGTHGIQNYVNIVSPDPQGYNEKTLYRFPAKGYHALRADLYDDALTSGLTVTASSLTYASNIEDHVMWVSGIQYFLPFDPTQNASWDNPANVNLVIDPITVSATGFFGDIPNQARSSYRTSPPRNGGWGDRKSTDFVGIFITTHGLKYSDQPPSGNLDNADALIANGNSWIQDSVLPNKRRIEYPINTLGGGGNWIPGTGPGPEFNSPLVATASGVFSYGDPKDPSFSTDVVLRAVFRRPIEHGITSQPHHISPLIPTDNSTMMLHTSCMPDQGPVPASVIDPEFGNHCINNPPPGVTPNKAIASVETAAKDHSERFLDEIYRYGCDWDIDPAAADGITGNYLANLKGPGLPFVTGPIGVPVRAGRTNNHATNAALAWEKASWVQYNAHGFSLEAVAAAGHYELQVAGMPDRNPPLTEGNDQPYPSAGRLMFPKVNYAGNNALGGPYRPALASNDISTAQYDYSGMPGAVSAAGIELNYVRAFDANFSRSSTNNQSPVSSGSVVADGQPFVYLKIWGLSPSDFEYSAGWPYGNKYMAILVKVPGMTTWMDIGRNDGSGPAKQDPAHDGAGCRVVGPQTLTDIGTPYNEVYQDDGVKQLHNCGVIYSQVKINVGPNVNLFKTNDPGSGLTNDGEAPILVKIVLRYDAASPETLKYDFAHKYMNGAFDANPDPDAATRDMRGVIGIELIRPDNA